MDAERLSFTLSADMAQRIRGRVEAGSYTSSSEAVREALHLFEDREIERKSRLDAIRAEIWEAMDDPVRLTATDMHDHFNGPTAEAENRPES